MSRKRGWLVAVVVITLLVVACSPEMATPTPRSEPSSEEPTATTALAGETSEPEPPQSGELPVDADDWHVLGSADAPVTIVEFSDFQ
jgi:protein-disulfide isomerase